MSGGVCFASASTLAREISAGRLSPVEVVEAYWNRIDEYDDALNAYVTTCRAESLDRAREAEAAVEQGDDLGPLHGVPVAVKDRFGYKEGMRHTFGSKPFEEYVPDFDAVFVERLEDAGAILLGKTNLPEFAYGAKTENRLAEPTPTPFDVSRTAGGSSGGSAAAVASGLAAVAQGSDVGGSIRLPAAFCGVFGLLPSFGRVPHAYRPDGFVGAKPMNGIGPLTRTVEDAALVLDVVAGSHPADPFSLGDPVTSFVDAVDRPIDDISVGYTPGLDMFQVERRVLDVVEDAGEAFEDAGATVERVSFDHETSMDEMREFHLTAMNVQFAALREHLLDDVGVDILAHRDDVTPHVVEAIEAGRDVSALEYKQIDVARTAFYDAVQDALAEYDLLVTPATSTPPFGIDEEAPSTVDGVDVDPFLGWLLTWPFNMTGHPVASVPAGYTDDGLPVGMQIVGRRRADDTVLAASAALERERPWQDAYPDLL